MGRVKGRSYGTGLVTLSRRGGLRLVAMLIGVITVHTIPRATHAVSSGLIAAYGFNEGAGTTVGDAAGGAWPGAIIGATWTDRQVRRRPVLPRHQQLGHHCRPRRARSYRGDDALGLGISHRGVSYWRTILHKEVDRYYLMACSGPLRIGGTSAYGEYFQGLIDWVRVYNRALTPGEIVRDMGTPILFK